MINKLSMGLIVLAITGALFFGIKGFLEKDNVFTVSDKSSGIVNSSGEINILIMGKVGVGQGGQWHSAPNLVDTIVLVNFLPKKGVVNLISLPRDLYGKIGDYPIRLNRVVHEKKIDDLLVLLPDITGIETDKYVVIDLETLISIVDGLGGIDVDLPVSVTDSVGGFTLQKGNQRLDGESAAWLIRNRFAPEGDFFREKNQHLVVAAIFEKFNQMSSIRKTAFAFRMLPSLTKSESNFSSGTLLSQLKKLNGVEFNSVILDFTTSLLVSSSIPVDGVDAYVLIPKEGVNEYGDIRDFIQKSIKGEIH